MSRRLLIPWPGRAAVVAFTSAILVAWMGIAYHRHRTGTAFDKSVDSWIRHRSTTLIDALIHLSDPPFVAVLFAVLIAAAIWRKRWDVATFALVTPLLATLLVEQVLKPWIHRTQSDPYIVHTFGYEPLAFPSGHETGIGSFLAVTGLLVLASRWSRRRKIQALVVMAVIDVLAAAALVGRYYHYATDTIGAWLVCVTVAIVVALAVDAIARYRAVKARTS